MFSHIDGMLSARPFLNYTAEHRYIWKNKQNKYPRIIFTPKTCKNSLKRFSFAVSLMLITEVKRLVP